MTENTKLVFLVCSVNKMKIFDVSENTILQSLQCKDNQISGLNNTALYSLDCDEDANVAGWVNENQ